MNSLIRFLAHKAYKLRYYSLIMPSHAQSGHTTSCLSAADIMSVLFFYALKFDPHNVNNKYNDRFILSKGHASALLYAAWKEAGVLTEDQLMTYREYNSVLEGHPTYRFVYAEAATGSLGMGLSIGLGDAFAARIAKLPYKTYVLLGDGEMSEGSVWEAVELAAFYKMNSIIGIIDFNRLGQSSVTMMAHDTERCRSILHAFGWYTIVVDGHNIALLVQAFDEARIVKNQPVMIIASTFKGSGVDFLEDKMGFHGKALNENELKKALHALQKRYPHDHVDESHFIWNSHPNKCIEKKVKEQKKISENIIYKKGDAIATREAYGQSIAFFGYQYDIMVCLDAEVKNSTYADIFEYAHPDRFVQCFIAEQNMVSMGVGFAKRGFIPFISTFASFFSRAYDQIRMSALSKAALRLVGSHAGVSIGQDGPSQMGLEDIAIMNVIPNSIILYPSDAVSTYRLVEAMIGYHEGISYLRTTRGKTEIIYDMNEIFCIGGCKIMRQSDNDTCTVVAAGITLFEALKVYDLLKKEGIFISVIDLYSIKPFDKETVVACAKKSDNIIITVEDHYKEGGIGAIISHALINEDIEVYTLAVPDMPSSGAPDKLLAWARIDAGALMAFVKKLCNK